MRYFEKKVNGKVYFQFDGKTFRLEKQRKRRFLLREQHFCSKAGANRLRNATNIFTLEFNLNLGHSIRE